MPQVQFEDNLLTVTGSLNDTTYRLTGALTASGDNPRLDYSPAGPYTVTFESDVFVGCEGPPLFVYGPDSVYPPSDPQSYTAIMEGPSPPYEISVDRNVGDDYTIPILSDGYLSFSIDDPPEDYSGSIGHCIGRITFSVNNVSAEFKISDSGALYDLVYSSDPWMWGYGYYPLVSFFPTAHAHVPHVDFGVREKEMSPVGLEYCIYASNTAEEWHVVGDVAWGDVVTVQVTPVPGGVEFKVNGIPYTLDVSHPSRVELRYGGMYHGDNIPSYDYDHAVGVRNIVVRDL